MDVNQRDCKNVTPLHFAVLQRECKNVELLIKYSANIDAQDFNGYTPLHIAVVRLSQDADNFEDYKRIMKELLFNGANRGIKNDKGHTPLDLLS